MINHSLNQYFNSEEEQLDHFLFFPLEMDSRTSFIVGLHGMIYEDVMIRGQETLGHLYSALNQTTSHWTTNFKRTSDEFKELWTDSEWENLIEFEKSFIRIYPKLMNWKHQPPKAPKLFENVHYQELKNEVVELIEKLSS